MKVYLGSIVIVVLLILTACSAIRTNGFQQISTTTETKTSNESVKIYAHAARLRFSSEEEFIKQIKSGTTSNPEYRLESLEYYFRPKDLPQNARLVEIFATDSYIAIEYATDNNKLEDSKNVFLFIWYRFTVDQFMRQMKESWVPMKGNENYSLKNIDNSAYGKGVIKMICWTQNGFGFQVNAPSWFTAEDALKFCFAEKVEIK